jgi:hypothetical protein
VAGLASALLALGVVGVQLLVPPATAAPPALRVAASDTPKQRAERLLNSPTGRRLLDVHIKYGTTPEEDAARNFNQTYLRGSAFNDTVINYLRRLGREKPLRIPLGISGKRTPVYGLWIAEVLDRSSYGDLFDDLAVPAAEDKLISITTVNDPTRPGERGFGVHSEEFTLQPLPALLVKGGMIVVGKGKNGQVPAVNTPAWRADAYDQVVELVRDASVAQEGDRAPCPSASRHCSLLTEKIPAKNLRFTAEFGTKDEQARARETVSETLRVAEPVRKTQKAEASKAAQKNLGAVALAPGKQVEQTGETGSCVSMPGGLSPSRTGVSVLAAGAADCGGQESNGVAKGLTADPSLGGVDFTTLELRYVQDRPGAQGVQYAFSGRPVTAGQATDENLGAQAISASAADLRTWLALDPSTFWVNLSPVEPDRIIDPTMGRTNAGRAMLEADFAMKRTEGRLLNPATAIGARYWKALDRTGSDCSISRAWIVPGRVEVRADGDSLYILKAPLDVKTTSDSLPDTDKDACPAESPAVIAQKEQLQRTIVLPEIVKAVNTEPEYAPLRRAFTARIIGQWVRDRHQSGQRTAFDDVLDTGDLGPAALTGNWRPRQVFDAFVQAFRSKEFTYKQNTHQGNRTITRQYVLGGVDFGKLRLNQVGAAEMNAQYPRLAETIHTSVDRPATAADGTVWLGLEVTQDVGRWDRLTRRIGTVTDGRAGTLLIILVGAAVLLFGFRSRPRRRLSP